METQADVKRMALEASRERVVMLEKMKAINAHPDERRLADLAAPSAAASLAAGPVNTPAAKRKRAPKRSTPQKLADLKASQTQQLIGVARGPGPATCAFRSRPRQLQRENSTDDFMFRKDQEVEADQVEAQEQDLEKDIDDQLKRYLRYPQENEMSASPVEFWQDNAHLMPHLATVALWILGIPGSTAALERLFSTVGRGIIHRRPRLLPSMAKRFIFGHANVRFGVTGAVVRQRRIAAATPNVV